MFSSICFLDTETKGREPDPYDNVTTVGTARYFETADVIMVQYAIDDGPIQVIDSWDGLKWSDMPDDFRRFSDSTLNHKYEHDWGNVFCAFNAAFDMSALNYGMDKEGPLPVTSMVDAMAQVAASNLPPSLEGVSRALGRKGKQQDGKRLIKLFCPYDSKGNPETHPQEWARFKAYGAQDVEELREIWHTTRLLGFQEWREYWAAEKVNNRGLPFDMEFVRRAAAVAARNVARSNGIIKEITDGVVTKVTQRDRIQKWVWARCVALEHPEALEIMTRAAIQDPDSPEDYFVTRKSLKRDRIERLLTYFGTVEKTRALTDDEIDVCDVLELRQWDGSSAPAKFAKIDLQTSGGSMFNSYMFNGAGQTGRFSSRGLQVHNMVRKFIGMEEGDGELEVEAIEMINSIEV